MVADDLAGLKGVDLVGWPPSVTVTRARMTQITNLLNLAPDIQEELLFLTRPEHGRAPITERHLRPLAAEPSWRNQRRMWRKVAASSTSGSDE